jgi:hypothetical protein
MTSKIKDSKGVIRSLKTKTNRQCNDQKKNNEGTNNDLENTSQQTKDRATLTTLKTTGVNSGVSGLLY